MPWNPETYNKFKTERYAPFYDLLALIAIKPKLRIIDLGCGTGELTSKLADKLPGANVLGIDSSPEMLKEARQFKKKEVEFQQTTIESIVTRGRQWDIVFSNAAIQWVENHSELIPAIIKTLKKGGQLAIQLPSNHTHYTHTAIKSVAAIPPYGTALLNWTRTVPVLDIESYSRILFENGVSNINVFEKIYPHVLNNADALVDWVSGTALVPYIERLPENLRPAFLNEYKKCIKSKYPDKPVFYPFKRIFIYGIIV